MHVPAGGQPRDCVGGGRGRRLLCGGHRRQPCMLGVPRGRISAGPGRVVVPVRRWLLQQRPCRRRPRLHPYVPLCALRHPSPLCLRVLLSVHGHPACRIGQFQPFNTLTWQTCQSCPAGQDTSSLGTGTDGIAAFAASACRACAVGHYQPVAGTACVPAPVNTYTATSGTGNTAVVTCSAGTSTLGSQAQSLPVHCVACVAGTYSAAGGNCTVCPVNTYAANGQFGGSDSCIPCNAGYDTASTAKLTGNTACNTGPCTCSPHLAAIPWPWALTRMCVCGCMPVCVCVFICLLGSVLYGLVACPMNTFTPGDMLACAPCAAGTSTNFLRGASSCTGARVPRTPYTRPVPHTDPDRVSASKHSLPDGLDQ
jgi:hypothetical protein